VVSGVPPEADQVSGLKAVKLNTEHNKCLTVPLRFKPVILILSNPVIWKKQVVLVVGAAFSRDHLISRLKAAPTTVFYGNLDFPDKRLEQFFASRRPS